MKEVNVVNLQISVSVRIASNGSAFFIMMNKITFFKSVLLTLVFIAVGAPVQAVENPITFTVNGISYKQFADDGYQNCVYVTPSIIGKYEGTIVIPDSVGFDGHRYKVLGIGDNSFKDCTELTSVQMDAIVVFIGNYAFANCTGLQELTVRLNNFWYAPSSMSNGIHVGYRAFFGCRLKSFTLDAHTTPPYYTQKNPSNNYNNVTDNQVSNWFDSNDYWVEYPYTYTVRNYTTLYVPAGYSTYYSNSEDYNYRQWGNFFSNIKEFGADADDNVSGMISDTIPNLMHYADSLMDIGMRYSMFAQAYLMQYIDSIAQAEGKQPDTLQLVAAFDMMERVSPYGTVTMKMIPEIKRILQNIYDKLRLIDDNDMAYLREEYYKAKNAYEIRAKYSPDVNWQNEKNEMENKKVEMNVKIAEMTRMVHAAAAELEYLVSLGDSLFVKEMWDFINAFKLKTTGISLTKSDVQSTRHFWYTLDGQRLERPMRGINIIDGKKIVVR